MADSRPRLVAAAAAGVAVVLLARRLAARRRPMPKSRSVGIIGAGVGAIAAAHRMLEAGMALDQITIYEIGRDFGGTWLKNTYPDCGCDVFSHAYSFSWAVRQSQRRSPDANPPPPRRARAAPLR